jgi:DNA-binding response OmpR family regulator
MNKILIMDDDQALQMLYADELVEEGYDVFTSGDASHLMEFIEEKRPDLVVMDIRLGKYDGLDLIQEIRNTYSQLPVIICTACPSFRRDMKSIGADYYVEKSSNLEELKLRIKMALGGIGQPLSSSSPGKIHQKEGIPRGQLGLKWENTDQSTV